MKQILNITNGTQAMLLDGRAKEFGEKLINLAAGDPIGHAMYPFDSSIIYCLNDKECNHYTNAQGSIELRRQLYKDSNKVLIGNGAKILMYLALKATCKPGDCVLIVGPSWSSYLEICKILNLQIIQYIPFYQAEQSWNNDPFELEKYFWNTDFSAVIFTNPNNPTGTVENKYFVHSLISLCEEHDCWLIADEIYDQFIYEGSFETCLDKSDNVIYINGFSKSYAMPGYRLGYCIAEEKLIQQMTLIQSQIAGPPNTLMQVAAVHFLQNRNKYIVPIAERNDYKQIIDLWCKNNSLFTNFRPAGGLYFYIPVKDEIQAYSELLSRGILVTPGSDYGVKNTLRISFSAITLEEAAIVKPYLDAIS